MSADLADHGDRQVPPGAVDLAVNVWSTPPGWLLHELAGVDLSRYPDPVAATAVAARRHGRPAEECLLVNGAAEAFWALAFGVAPRLAACVHPSFTAPEAALRAAGVDVVRVVRRPDDGFALDVGAVPDAADLVVLGRPDNPTGRVESVAAVAALCRPDRTVVVDEAFAEFLPDAAGLAGHRDLPGLVCVRSLTKIWAVPGLRVGYLVGPAEVIDRAGAALQPWPVSSPALRAIELLLPAEDRRAARAAAAADARDSLAARLGAVPGLRVWPSAANYLLLRHRDVRLREALLDRGLAVRRADTFPGLDPSFVRVAVHSDPAVRRRLVDAVTSAVRSSG